jgi:hypothetical protein
MAHIIGGIAGCLLLSACTTPSTSGPGDMETRQDAAMQHPFDSSPGHVDTDISGGGIGESKGLNRDIDHVLNP